MRKTKFFSTAMIVAAAFCMAVPAGIVKADDATEEPELIVKFDGDYEKQHIVGDDAEVINTEFGYWLGKDEVYVCSEDASAWIDWEASGLDKKDVYLTQFIIPVFTRYESGKLHVSHTDTFYESRIDYTTVAWRTEGHDYANTSWFALTEEDAADIEGQADYAPINSHMGSKIMYDSAARPDTGTRELELTDVYILRIFYTVDGKENYFDNDSDDRETRMKGVQRTDLILLSCTGWRI